MSEERKVRRPVAMTEVQPVPGRTGGWTVACDDGAVFEMGSNDVFAWRELPPIPGTDRAHELEAQAAARAAALDCSADDRFGLAC